MRQGLFGVRRLHDPPIHMSMQINFMRNCAVGSHRRIHIRANEICVLLPLWLYASCVCLRARINANRISSSNIEPHNHIYTCNSLLLFCLADAAALPSNEYSHTHASICIYANIELRKFSEQKRIRKNCQRILFYPLVEFTFRMCGRHGIFHSSWSVFMEAADSASTAQMLDVDIRCSRICGIVGQGAWNWQ